MKPPEKRSLFPVPEQELPPAAKMEPSHQKQCEEFAQGFAKARDLLAAIGNETRQYILYAMMSAPSCQGLQISQIAKRASLSRASASYHVQILVRCGLLQVRHEGTRNYYQFASDAQSLHQLIGLLEKGAGLLEKMCSDHPDLADGKIGKA